MPWIFFWFWFSDWILFIQNHLKNGAGDSVYTCGVVITVFMSALNGLMSLGFMTPNLESIDEARMAAYKIYEVIESIPVIQQEEEQKKRKLLDKELFGKIEFKNVTFCYPSRPDVKVLNNFNMVFEPGKMTGICGETGSGKSTIIQLIERFYEPTSGVIEVDGVDIKTLNLTWWRSNIGFVGQEPVLFNTTIKANIEYGKPGASQQDIEEAGKQANCMEFISKIPEGFNSETGVEGSKLSGGQKQRVAIARALVKKPKIMLFDEATSALDNTSEKKVQEAINKLEGITIIVIAHRLTTINNANKIIVLHDGVLKEEGNDGQLKALNGIYANLCRLQTCQDGN